MRTFDEAAFRAKFRAAARERAIDPMKGATSYQAALMQAELRRAATLAAPDYGWWRGRDLDGASEESPRWEHVRIVKTNPERLIEAGRDDDLIPLDDAAIAELWREVRRELVDRSTLPLRRLHAHQAAWETAAMAGRIAAAP